MLDPTARRPLNEQDGLAFLDVAGVGGGHGEVVRSELVATPEGQHMG